MSSEGKKVAFVLINVKVGMERATLEEIKKVSYVKEAYITMGGRDMVIKIVGSNVREIYNVVLNKIRQIPYVTQTMTLVAAGDNESEER